MDFFNSSHSLFRIPIHPDSPIPFLQQPAYIILERNEPTPVYIYSIAYIVSRD